MRIITAVLLLLAAVFGWLLPDVITAISDQRLEGKVQAVDIAPLSLSVDSPVEKIEWIASEWKNADKRTLKQGRFSKEAEIVEIASCFLMDSKATNRAELIAATPMLGQFWDGTSMIVWEISMMLANGKAKMLVDDASGLILHIRIDGEDSKIEPSVFAQVYQTHLKDVAGETCEMKYTQRKTHPIYYRLQIHNGIGVVANTEMIFDEHYIFVFNWMFG